MTLSGEEISEEKDRTKLIWASVILLVAVMAGALWLFGSPHTFNKSVVRVRHILIECNKSNPTERIQALEIATKLRERIVAGESFKKLAKTYSGDTNSARRGGDVGYMERGSFTKEFEAYVWDAPIDQISEIIETEFGFHIIQVMDRKLSAMDAQKQASKAAAQ